MPDRSDRQLILVDPKFPLGLGQLDVPFPERCRVEVAEITPQDVASFGDTCPCTPVLVTLPGDLQPRFALGLEEPLDADLESASNTPVLLEQPAQPAIRQALLLEMASRRGRLELAEPILQSQKEALVHRLFLCLAVRAAGEYEHFVGIRTADPLDFESFLDRVPILMIG